MKRTLLIAISCLLLGMTAQAQNTRQQGCQLWPITGTGYTLVHQAAPGEMDNVQMGYYTAGSPASVSIQLAGGYVGQATSNPFDLGSAATNTTSADFGSQAGAYPFWYIHTNTLTGGSTLYVTVCVNSGVVKSLQQGGTVLTTGTSGGIPYFSSSSTIASTGALSANALALGGGAGTAPFTAAGLTTDGTSQLRLGVAGASVGSTRFANATSGTITLSPPTGALGTPTVTLPALTGSVGTGYDCGTVSANGACANTATGGTLHAVFGIATLASNTSTITGISPAFTSASTFYCVANDITTRANPVQAIPASASTVTFTNTTGATDNIQFMCNGY